MIKQQNKITRKMLLQQVANRSGYDINTVSKVYGAIVDAIVESVQTEHYISLTGFGNFYLQHHKGHPVQFESSDSAVHDYKLLKFSASDALNRRLRDDIPVDVKTEAVVEDEE
jgi:nucleoid DNA-binding protein